MTRQTDEAVRRPATIQDVAIEAGVSKAAVSKVIRNAYGVSPAMREVVNVAIERLGYRPRVAARAMRGSTFTLGINLPEFDNQFFTRVVQGVTDSLSGSGYRLIISPADGDVEESWRSLQMLADHQVDGIVGISPLVDPRRLERLGAQVPLVMLGRHIDSASYDTVTNDDVAGARAVMRHLLELGHTRIAHLTQPSDQTVEGSGGPHALRLTEYLAAMRAAGLADRISVLRAGPTERDAWLETNRMLDAAEPPTALFVGNDQLALGVLRAAAERGLGPGRLSVAGYDDIALAGHPAIGLTTIDQHGWRIGAEAVELLLERVRGRVEPRHTMLEPELRVRTSTAPPEER